MFENKFQNNLLRNQQKRFFIDDDKVLSFSNPTRPDPTRRWTRPVFVWRGNYANFS